MRFPIRAHRAGRKVFRAEALDYFALARPFVAADGRRRALFPGAKPESARREEPCLSGWLPKEFGVPPSGGLPPRKRGTPNGTSPCNVLGLATNRRGREERSARLLPSAATFWTAAVRCRFVEGGAGGAMRVAWAGRRESSEARRRPAGWMRRWDAGMRNGDSGKGKFPATVGVANASHSLRASLSADGSRLAFRLARRGWSRLSAPLPMRAGTPGLPCCRGRGRHSRDDGNRSRVSERPQSHGLDDLDSDGGEGAGRLAIHSANKATPSASGVIVPTGGIWPRPRTAGR